MRHSIWKASRFVFIALALLPGLAHAGGIVLGVGATFPKEVYQQWGKQYKAETGNAFAYFPRGSGRGIESILAGKSDFGASDKPLTADELEKNRLVQFPALIGGVIPVVNVKGVGEGQLQLDGSTLAAIYMGKIKRWNDAAVAALNPGVALPNEAIKVLYRSDRSGSTYVLTEYFSKVSPEWHSTYGAATAIDWKVGEGADGGDALAKQFAATPGAIAYLDPSLVRQGHLNYVKLRNHDGTFVSPNHRSFAAAAVKAKWSATNGFSQSLTDQPGADSWPIVTATYVLFARTPMEVSGAEDALKYFDWTFRNGGGVAQDHGFVLLPLEAMQDIRQAWKEQIRDRSGRPLWK
jgi:phosphate transport system substrate-binding protein